MKVMISQPMKGKTEKQIREERKDAVELLEKEGFEVVDTIFTDEPPKDTNAAIWYLSKSIEVMGKVDGVIFLPGWRQARGCIIENQVALAYGKFIKYC